VPSRVFRDSTVVIASLLPDVLGTYGDGGNAQVLARRLTWRGVTATVVPVTSGVAVPASADVYLLGGGEDHAQVAASERLRASGRITGAVARGAVVFGVCAGLQLLGEWFTDWHGRRHAGLGLLDARTDRLRSRAVGEVVAEPLRLGATSTLTDLLTGFENHGGRTTLGPEAAPLGRVTRGVGNGDGGVEGAVGGRVVGTYLHGPVLARNPALADALLGLVVDELPPLDDSVVDRLRRNLVPTAA
jgi:lipid II isoglutaminyl synthase (glutamine-hydrolysing)